MFNKMPFLLILALTSFMSSTWASPVIPVTSTPPSAQPAVTPAAPNIDAKGYVLLDANSGKILAQKNADQKMAPASLTKLMSLYIISGALKSGSIHLDDKVRVSEKAWHTGGSRMFIKVGDEVPVRDLMQGIIVASGNDATVAMAEYVAGSEESFTDMMNTQAKTLGMNNSHFTDSTGLPNPAHFSTPHDFALLAQALTQHYPEDYKLFSEKWFTYNGIRQPNRNRLLWRYQFADGLKTGHTDDAGYCLVASALKDKMRLISVVMGAPSDAARTEDSMRLLTYDFRFYKTQKIYQAQQAIAQARAWKGMEKQVSLGLASDLYITLPVNQFKNIESHISLDGPIKAPVAKGQAYGTLNVMVNRQIIATKPLVALADDPKGGFWRRFTDSINYNLHRLFSKPTTIEVSHG